MRVHCAEKLIRVSVVVQDHSRFVNCVRFSPDGNRYVSAGADGQVRVQRSCAAAVLCVYLLATSLCLKILGLLDYINNHNYVEITITC